MTLSKAIIILKKVFFFTLFAIITVLCAGIISVYLYGDKIKNRIIANLNTQINTPIQVGFIDINAIDHFPNLTISLNDVFVQESIEFSDKPLLTAQKLDLIFNPLKIIRSDYSINSMAVYNGRIDVLVDRKGRYNYTIFKKNEANPNADPYFNIEKLYLNSVIVNYKDEKANQDFLVNAKQIAAGIKLQKKVYFISYEGDSKVEYIRIGEEEYLANRENWSSANLEYHTSENKVVIEKGNIYLNNANFNVSGYYAIGDNGKINILVEGENTSIQNLVTLLPEKHIASLQKYNSQGDVYFDLELSGSLTSEENPAISIHFGCKNTTITHPDTNKKITSASFEGFYISNSISDYQSAELSLSGLSGVFDDKPFRGNISLKNFEDKVLKLNLETNISLESLLEFFPNNYLKNGSGDLAIDIAFHGRLRDLEKVATLNRVSSSGQIEFINTGFELAGWTRSFTNVSGVFLFSDQNIALNEVGGFLGSSHFILNGMLGNIFPYLVSDNNKIVIDAKLQSNYIDLNELLSISGDSVAAANSDLNSNSEYSLNIPAELSLNFDCNVRKLNFRRFDGRNISGILNVKDQMAMFRNIRFQEAGGNVFLEGFVDTGGKTVEVLSRFDLNNINVDSLFYIFEDFNQDWLVYNHLSGKMTSTVTAEMSFTKSLNLIPQSLVADMTVGIKGGELNNFEPMQLLAPYLPKDNLDRLRFSELKNEIHVENETVYIPQMEIKSNVTEIQVGGTHTFDQHINYTIVAPLINKPRVDPDELFGAVEDDGTNSPKIHLLLTGTTDDYKISLDKKGTRNQIITDLKSEVKELKEAFKIKQDKKKKTLELEEDYFDWDDH